MERKAVSNNECYSPFGDYEFSGNGCDTDNSDSDFVSRNNPNPQNSHSLPEPRKKPTIPQNFSISFSTSTMTLNLSWDPSLDCFSTSTEISYQIKDISNASSTLPFPETSKTSISKRIREIGRNYQFQIQSFDKDGLSSEPTSSKIFIPSFLDSLYFYKVPDNPDLSDKVRNKYFVDLNFSRYPFIPDLFNEGMSWKRIEFYLNGKLIKIKYQYCSGESRFRDRLILADDEEHCLAGGGLERQGLRYYYLEDNHLSFEIEPKREFTKNDYLTIRFYSLSFSGFGRQEMGLVAIDKTKYYFQGDDSYKKIHLPPFKPRNLKFSFCEKTEDPYFLINWDKPSDPDSLDDTLSYYLKISKDNSSSTNSIIGNFPKSSRISEVKNNTWYRVYRPKFYPKTSGKYTFSLKICDELNLCSPVSTISAPKVNIPQVIIEQPEFYETFSFVTNKYPSRIFDRKTKYVQEFSLDKKVRINSLKLFLGVNDSVLHYEAQGYLRGIDVSIRNTLAKTSSTIEFYKAMIPFKGLTGAPRNYILYPFIELKPGKYFLSFALDQSKPIKDYESWTAEIGGSYNCTSLGKLYKWDLKTNSYLPLNKNAIFISIKGIDEE